MILGLTGGYCVGKNFLAAKIVQLGFEHIDVDKLGHIVLEEAEVLAEIREHFSKKVACKFGEELFKNNVLDRKLLGKFVFNNRRELVNLEKIIHPRVYNLLTEKIEQLTQDKKNILINAALLYKMPQAQNCDRIIEVRAPLWLRLRRALQRDGANIRTALARILRQRYLWPLARKLAQPPIIIFNDDKTALEEKINQALNFASIAKK